MAPTANAGGVNGSNCQRGRSEWLQLPTRAEWRQVGDNASCHVYPGHSSAVVALAFSSDDRCNRRAAPPPRKGAWPSP
jgi:hypothetical protein